MKKTFLTILAVGAAATVPTTMAQAQKLGPAVVAVVDRERIFTECTACKAAQAQLQSQLQQLQTRAQQLGQPLQTEAQSLDTAIKALNGKEPDAALQQRATAFQQKQGAAQQEISQGEQTFGRNRAYVAKQIEDRLNPIVSQQMTAKGANIAIDMGMTIATAKSVDITNDVLAELNRQLPSVGVVAPAPAPAAAPAATPAAPAPKPKGR